MLRPSEPWRACGKVRDIITTSIPDSGEINNFDFIPIVGGSTTEHIVNLDISVGNLMVMHILDCLANFNENDPGDIR